MATLLASCLFPGLAFGTNDIWLGGTGTWSTTSMWSAGVPTSTSNVFIDNGNAVASSTTINYNGAQCGSLKVDSDDSLIMVDGTIFTLFGPTVSNAGKISLNSAGFGVYFNFGGAVTLTGAGTVTMSNNSANYLMGYAQPSGASLTNQSTIQGAGNIGFSGGIGTGNSFTNQGTVNANQTTPFLLQVSSGSVTNTGTLEATNGGTLTINGGGTLTNSGGTIHAGPASIVSLASGVTVLGGTLSTSGTGTIQANCCFNDGTLNGVTNNGTFQLNNGNIQFLAGTITNNGSLQVNSTGSGSYLNVSGTVMLKGSGVLTMANNNTNYIMGYAQAGPGASLINQSTIQGAGNFGFTGGIGTGNSVTNKGTIFANQTTSLFINVNSGTFSNTGTLKVKAGSVMYIGGPGFANFSGTTLTGGTYLVNGTLEFDGAKIVTNAASITLTGSSSQIINQSAANGLANFATNTKTGSLSLMSGKMLATTGNVSNAGKITVGAGSGLQIGVVPNGTYTQTAGTTTVDGVLAAPTGVSIQAGTLFGKGTIAASVVSSGSVTAGDSATKPGKLSASTYTQNATGSLNIAIGGLTAGTQYGQLAVANGISLKGTLNIKLINGFVPAIGKTFTILTGTAITGTFATVNGLSINSSEHFTIAYHPTNVTLTVVSGP